jgi:predicted outer membrane repeat protein
MSLRRQNRSLFRRRLLLEPLESRRVLTVFGVNSLSDVTAADSELTLREAIALAASDPDPEFDLIDIQVPGTIKLTQGELTPTTPVQISGFNEEGVSKIQTTIDADGKSRIFSFSGTTAAIQLLRLTGGSASDSGGAIHATDSDLFVFTSLFEGNSATGNGGAIFANGVSNLDVEFCTFANNFANSGDGGAIAANTSGQVIVVNSTLSGNRATGSGGGAVVSGSGPSSFTNSTIVLNRADSDGNFAGSGGGVASQSGPPAYNNTIVAGNVQGADEGTPSDIENGGTGGSNIVDSTAGSPFTNGVNGNIVGDFDVESIINPFLRRSGVLTPVHLLVPGSPALDAGSNARAQDAGGEPLTVDQRGEARIFNGDSQGSAIVDIGAVEIAAPSFTIGNAVSFTENGNLTLLASGATFFDADSANLGGGLVVVSITRNTQDGDTLSIRNQGLSAGQIGVSGRYIKYGGKTIGSFSGGAGDPLVVRLNANATPTATRDLLRNIGYRHVGENPSPLPRTIAFAMEDGDGGVAARRFKQLSVVPVNDAPKLTGATTRNYTLNDPNGVALTPSATVTDVDSANFFNGTLRVAIVSGDNAANRLFVGGSFTKTGDDIFLNGVKVGTLTASGFGLNDLVIKFTSAATPSIVQSLVRAIKFKTVSGTVKAQQLINFTLTDGDGGTSNTIQVTLNVN